MARYIPDGKLRVFWVASIADRTAVTAAEIAAGVDLTAFLRSLTTPDEGSIVPVPDPTSRFNKTTSGTTGGQPVNGEWYRDEIAANDTAWATLVRGAEGHFVIRRADEQDSGATIAAGDLVEVWPQEITSRNPRDYQRNDPDGFATVGAVPNPPEYDVTVAA